MKNEGKKFGNDLLIDMYSDGSTSPSVTIPISVIPGIEDDITSKFSDYPVLVKFIKSLRILFLIFIVVGFIILGYKFTINNL